MVRHLYIHLPFCPSICPYCSFHVERVERAKMDSFAARLEREFEELGPLTGIETIYFGGGTPTAFSVAQLEILLDIVQRFTPPFADCEVSIEANPSTLSPEKCRLLKERGVGRVSLGAQSFDNDILRVLGRKHTAAAVRRAWELLRAAGFRNLNIDLMFGVPSQTAEAWRRSLRAALELQPEHISCYNLTYEEDTPFFESLQRGFFDVDEDLNARMFEQTEILLETSGYHHYEISNYALPGFECRHNEAYWAGEDYVGLGPSAVSTVGAKRWRMENGRPVIIERLSEDLRRREQALLQLRTSRGAEAAHFPQERWKSLIEDGLARLCEGRLILTRSGRLRADAIAVHLME